MVTRNVALTELPMRGISVNTLAGTDADITVVPSDSGILFVNKYTSATKYTLPAVTEGAGKWFWFFNAHGSAATKVACATAIIVGKDSATGKVLTDGSTIGDACLVIGDGTNYFAFVLAGTWTTGSV